MAEAFGLGLDISGLTSAIKKYQDGLDNMLKGTENITQSVIQQLLNIGSKGVDPLLGKLQEQKNALEMIAKAKLDGVSEEFTQIAVDAGKALNETNALIGVLEQLANMGLSRKDDDAYNSWLKSSAEEAERYEEIERQKFNATKQRIGEQNAEFRKGEDAAYQAWLENADKKATAEKVQDDAKFQRQKDNIYKQNAEFKRQEQQRQEEQARSEKRTNDEIFKERLRQFREENRQRQDLEKMIRATEKKRHEERRREYEELFREQERLWKQQSQDRKDSYNRAMAGDTTEHALGYTDRVMSSKGLRSINNMHKAISMMQDAQRKLNLNTEEGQKKYAQLESRIKEVRKALDEATGSSKRLSNTHKGLMDISGQLARKLALVFSVSQITGYIKKLVEVRGEFELQQKALQAIVQNVDEANKLWQKTVDLAVKSPFRVKELVTYTKQLAAYRVETDKLYDTTKMLADVSAGLGVDMQRLILAYGQVKAANYLRGTELRQFSEAGINILGELAKYFTELEGRAVSVGDVFERVSKRMVAFTDVEEIFKRITSEGGTFYNMQEMQAETMKGMWSNLQDSIDIMLNDVGKKNETTIKRYIGYARQMIEGWRNLVPYIETAGISFLTYFGVDVLRKVIRAFKTLWATASAHPLLAILSVVGLVATAIWRAVEAQNAFNAAMSEVDNEILKSLEQSISLYHKLTETINDATKSNEERNRALDNLKSKFQDILPDQYLELEYIEQLAGNYKAAENAMMDYYNAKAREQKKDRVEGMYAKELEGTDIPELITSAQKVIQRLGDEGIVPEDMRTRLLSGVSGVINGVIEDVKAGKVDASYEKFRMAIISRLAKYAGIEEYFADDWVQVNTMGFEENIGDILNTLREYRSSMKMIEGLPFETFDQEAASEMIQKEAENVNVATNAFKKAASLYEKYVNAIPTATKTVEQQREEIEQDVQKILTDLPQEMTAYATYLEQLFGRMKESADQGAFSFRSTLQQIQSDLYSGDKGGFAKIAFDNVTLNEEANDAAKQMVLNFQEGLNEQGERLKLTPFQNAVIEGARQIADKFGQDVDIFAKFVPNQEAALSTVRQDVKATIESFEAQIQEMSTSLTQNMYVLSTEVLNNTSDTIASMTNQLPALRAFLAFLGEMEKPKGGSDNTIEEKIKVVDQMNAKFKELNKTLSKAESLEGAFDAYKDAFATAYGREDVRTMSAEDFAKNVLNFPNEDAVIKWLDDLAKTVKDKEDKIKVELAKGKFEMDIEVRLKKKKDEELQKEIADMFDQYDLSLELKNLHIPSDLAKDIWGIESIELDDIRKKVEDELAKARAVEGNEDRINQLEKDLEKINDMEDKAAIERMKTYSKYLMEGMSERVKLKIEEMRKLKEIEESEEFTPEQKERIKQGVSKEARAEQQKQDWKDFQGSEMYTMMFEDLEHYGTAAIDMLYTKLGQLKEQLNDLPASEVKEIVGQIEKLENIKIERNPFESWKTYAEEVKKIGFSEEELQTQLLDSQKAEEEAQKIVDIYNTAMQSLMSEDEGVFEELDSETMAQWTQLLRLAEEMGVPIEDIVKDKKKIVENSKKEQAIITKNLRTYKKLSKAQKEAADLTTEYLNQIGRLFDASAELMESLGVESDSVAMTIAETGSNMTSLIMSAIQFTLQLDAMEMEANSALGVIGYVAIALQAVASILSAIFSAKDKALQKEIDGHIARADKLHKQYEELSDAIDTAYDASKVRELNKEIERTLELEIASIKAAIALEKSQKAKKIDWGYIDEQEERIEELYNTLNEEHESYIERWGGFGSEEARFDFIENMTQAWLDSFKETGDGLKGLEEEWDEYFDNLALKQMAMRVSKKAIDDYLDLWDKYVSEGSAGGEDLTEAEENDLRLKKEDLLRGLSEKYTSLAESLGVKTDQEAGGLSSLTKGIQGMSEAQAEILSAYWNSVRGYTASIDAKMDLVLANMGLSSSDENPMLSQLRLAAEQTKAINTLLNSLTKTGHSQGGIGLKVFMD